MATINFNEFAVGTRNPRYTFTGNGVSTVGVVVNDSSQPASPAFAASSSYLGPVFVYFDNPVASVSVAVGYFDSLSSTRIEYRNSAGQLLSSMMNTGYGVQTFSYSNVLGIKSIMAIDAAPDANGFSLDTVVFGDTVAATRPPVVTPVTTPAAVIDRDYGVIGKTPFVFTDSLGGADTVDYVRFQAPSAGVMTVTSSLSESPTNKTNTTIPVTQGINNLQIVPGPTYSIAKNYTLNFAYAPSKSVNEQAIDDWIDNKFADVFKAVIFDYKEAQFKLFEVISNNVKSADDAVKMFGKLSKAFATVGIVFDVANRIDNIYHATDYSKQLFIESTDLLVGITASGAVGVGASFVGTPIAGVIGGFATNLIYTFAVSDSVKGAAGTWYDQQKIAIAPVNGMPQARFGLALPLDLTPYTFDSAYYLATYPDAATAVASGQAPSAYFHYLFFGAAAGYKPNTGAAAIPAAQIVVSQQSKLYEGPSNAIFTSAAGSLVGDRLSDGELRLFSHLNSQRTEGTELSLNPTLTVLANRVARDWIINHPDGPNTSYDPTHITSWANALSNGQTLAQAFASLSGLPSGTNLPGVAVLGAFTSATEAGAILASMLSDSDAATQLLGLTNKSIGIGEYGGVWIILLSSAISSGNTVAETATETRLFGSDQADVLYTGFGLGRLSGNEGADDLVGGPLADVLNGGAGSDWLKGMGGGDILIGGDGDDRLQSLATLAAQDRPAISKLISQSISTLATALSLDNNFELEADSAISSATAVPHTVVNATSSGTWDYYRITVNSAGAKGVFDIDGTSGFDSYLRIYNAAGSQLASNDDYSPIDAGSTTSRDSYLTYTFGAAGTYYVSVSAYSGSPASGSTYRLNVSMEGAVVAQTASPTTLIGGAGNDTIEGGAGNDVAEFSGNLAQYRISRDNGSYSVSAKTGNDGTDRVSAVETLKFSDKSVNLTVQAVASAAAASEVQKLIELYVAFFNRVPDADGLAYWIGQLNSQSLTQIADSFYAAGTLPQYAPLTGFYADMNNTDFINLFYKNVLGRSEGADSGGLSYWTNQLASGASTRGSLGLDIVTSAHTFKGNAQYGYVADLLDNKIAVAKTVAIDWGLTYNTDAYTQAKAIATAVTPSDISVALALVGLSVADMGLA